MHLHNDQKCYLKSNAIYPQLLLNNSRLNVVDVKFEIYDVTPFVKAPFLKDEVRKICCIDVQEKSFVLSSALISRNCNFLP